jgi:hypothetical protein
MGNYVTDTQALVKFMLGKKVINDTCHKAFLDADQGKNTRKIGDVSIYHPSGVALA